MAPARIALIAIQTALASAAAASAQTIAGEYTFHVLGVDDRGADTLASGRFVLTLEPVDLSQLPAELVRSAQEDSRWLIRFGDRQPNTCFGFERSPASVDGQEFYGGIIAAGFSRWREDDGEIRVHVYQSPDASQFLVGRQTADGIAGTVAQHNFDGTSHMDWLRLRARRVGPASVESCRTALELAARHVREHR